MSEKHFASNDHTSGISRTSREPKVLPRACERCDSADRDDGISSHTLCRYCAATPPCDLHHRLPDGLAGALTGYSTRAVRALAHLADAYSVADDRHVVTIIAAMRALLEGHSFDVGHRRIAAFVIAWRFDGDGLRRILTEVGLLRFEAEIFAWRAAS